LSKFRQRRAVLPTAPNDDHGDDRIRCEVQRVALFFATICNYFLFGPVVP
jgi:hypothetical protein